MIDLTPAELTPAQIREQDRQFWRGVWLSVGFTALLWLIEWAHRVFSLDLRPFAVVPREWPGLLGVLTSPLVHGGPEHLAANSVGILMLGTLMLFRYPQSSKLAIPLIWMVAGFGTWLIGRPSFHIGASGVTHGLMFFLFLAGLIRRDRLAIAAMLAAMLFFGGMFFTILPRESGVSFEAHLSGAIGGLIAALLTLKRDPAPPRRKYSWEIEEELESELAKMDRETLEPARPVQVNPIWDGPRSIRERLQGDAPGQVIEFRRRVPVRDANADHDDEPPTRH
ncbi:rhomboid family intramembrane serine protease [Ahniella affigens]|uniref:Rhomboid family intramembrane serine protease n=1 Tax=Ahniella affigens TaxID=2021234 RepID=A0A2P1PVU6_9GAMM|nr:rhomboid family intramembrane serine protease [Ahniella affigens]AVP98977.1 rhomboid family intramembrane serine protease [Ahniella affigens]